MKKNRCNPLGFQIHKLTFFIKKETKYRIYTEFKGQKH